jgi:septum formation protein
VRLLLASRSEPRRRILEAAGVSFQVVSSNADEETAKQRFREQGLAPAALADALAEAKALGVAAVDALILGCDQTLERADGGGFDKPVSRAEAKRQLEALSGTSHRLHSAAVIVEAGAPVWRCTESVTLRMRPLSQAFLESYLDAEYDAIRHGVGGYRIEGPGVQLFDRIEGGHFAILGLPLLPLLAWLRERGLLAS